MTSYLRTIVKLIVISFIFTTISVQASYKSEQKRHHKLQKKWVYKAYRKLSKESIRTITKTYNSQISKEDKPLDRAYPHALLAFIWSMGLDADFAIAESHLSLKKATKPKDKYIAETALSLAFYNKGWITLARDKSQKLQNTPEFSGFAQKYENENLFANLMIGSLAIREGNLSAIHDTFGKISKKTNKPWITSLAKGVSLTLNSSPLDAAKHFKALINDPQLTVNERKKINEIKLLAENKLTEKSQDIKVSRLLNKLLFEAIKTESKQGYQKLITKLYQYVDDVDI